MPPEIKKAIALVEKYAGCGDNSCLFAQPKGMATNGGCRCLERGNGARSRLLGQALAVLYREIKRNEQVEVADD